MEKGRRISMGIDFFAECCKQIEIDFERLEQRYMELVEEFK